MPSEVSVSLESGTEQPDEVFDRAQQLLDAAAPFELRGWWAPAPTQRWAPAVERSTDADPGEEDRPVKLQRPPPKQVGKPPPYAAVYADVLPESNSTGSRRPSGRAKHAVVGLKFTEWFQPFDTASRGAPHPISLDWKTLLA